MNDSGGTAVAQSLVSSAISTLKLSFTGASNGTARALASSLRDGCALRRLNLCGNCIGGEGIRALVEVIALSDCTPLEELNLNVNSGMRPGSLNALFGVLHSTSLRKLWLAGCMIDRGSCAKLASALPHTLIEVLDISANSFGDCGAWDLAWVLAECVRLQHLNLSDCEISDDGADELAESVGLAVSLVSLDLRGNTISKDHKICLDPRANASYQRLVRREA